MQEMTRDVRATLTVFTDEKTGRQVGAMYRLETGAGPRWVGEVHDYDGEFPDGPYDPITLGAFGDGDEVRTEIRERVRVARGGDDPSEADDAPEDGTCGQPWVAEIGLCPRCGKGAAAHAEANADRATLTGDAEA